MNLKNPFSFKPLTDDETKKIAQAEKELTEESQATADGLRELLSDEKYIRYRKEYFKMREAAIELGQSLAIADPIRSNEAYKAIFMKIDIYGYVLGEIDKDIKDLNLSIQRGDE